MFRCNLPHALLAQWPGSFTCHCSNTGVERTSNKSQHTRLGLEKKILPPLLPGFQLATFRSRVRRSYQQAIPAPLLCPNCHTIDVERTLLIPLSTEAIVNCMLLSINGSCEQTHSHAVLAAIRQNWIWGLGNLNPVLWQPDTSQNQSQNKSWYSEVKN